MMKTVSISGMHCASCALGIETFLRSQNGIKMATVDIDENEARIRHTDDVNLDAVWGQVEDMGYSVEQA